MKKSVLILVAILLLHIFLLLNLKFVAWPEMTSFAYLKNNGFLLYKDMIHAYPPLLTLLLSYVYSVFGYKIIVLKLFTWMIVILNGVLIFLIGQDVLKSDKAALFGVFFYMLTQPFLEGNGLWFEMAITPLLLLGVYFFIKSFRREKRTFLFASGFFLGLAFAVKQIAITFFVLAMLLLISRKTSWKRIFTFLSGVLVILGFLYLRLYGEGQVVDFVYWVFVYPAFWVKFPGNIRAIPSLQSLITLVLINLPLLYGILEYRKFLKIRPFLFTLFFYLTSFLFMYPAFSFFRLQPTIALLSIVTGYVLSKVELKKEQVFLYLLFVLGFLVLPVMKDDWHKETRFYENKTMILAEKIKDISKESKTVYFLGVHSGFYPILGKIPPKPWVDNFPWYLKAPGVEEWVLSGWQNNPPEYIFASEPSTGQEINKWIEENYTITENLEEGVKVWLRK